jgi:hypothetical protein
VVVRIRHDGTRVEPLVLTRAFDVTNETLWFVADDGVHAMPR